MLGENIAVQKKNRLMYMYSTVCGCLFIIHICCIRVGSSHLRCSNIEPITFCLPPWKEGDSQETFLSDASALLSPP